MRTFSLFMIGALLLSLGTGAVAADRFREENPKAGDDSLDLYRLLPVQQR